MTLTPFQRALYVVEQLRPGTGMNNVPVAARFQGPLDVARLRAAISQIVARHAALRTTFPGPEQVVGVGRVDLPTTQVDSEHAANELVRSWAGEPFDLTNGPLLRTRLLRLAPDDHILVVVMHQLITDGPSLQVFFDELADGYAGLGERPEPAGWAPDQTVADDDLKWWQEHLQGVPTVLRLPTDQPRPRVATSAGANHVHVVPAKVMAPVLRRAQELRVTPLVLMLTAYAALLARMAGQEQVLVGVPVSRRDRVELESAIGLFVNTLPVLVDTTGAPGFGDLCRRVQSELLDILEYADVPFDRIVAEVAPERHLSHAPLVQTYFSFESAPIVTPRLAGTTATAIECPQDDAKVDLDLTIFRAEPDSDDFRLTFTYRTDLFAAGTIAALAGQLEQLLASAAADPTFRLPAVRNRDTTAAAPPVVEAAAAPAQPEIERELVRIWQDVLGRTEVGLQDNFFDLGGTSFTLLATQSRLRALTGTAPPLVALLEYPTVAALAGYLGGAAGTAPAEQPTERLLAGRDRLRQRRRTARADNAEPT
ncbi:hypothetical protein HPO96_21085 [Kribbella sandramycini]|uniref:Carrier domain-containing protein n=1 Tax=Kribbella sandramycini TaxID=60450 RepID=A0A7Y4L1Q8_9ACTN|nr:condensation domain-containing protein [Kribbella sandramycini]MBB6566601.1 hypothetical protein [Kribbella sandramycini]NOL42744.1 hypothetical protein [Kribbella sandramycini]